MIFEIYNTPKPITPSVLEWHWRLVKVSGNIPIANSAQSYETKADCEASIHLVMLTDYSTPVVEITEKQKVGRIGDILNSYTLAKKAKTALNQ